MNKLVKIGLAAAGLLTLAFCASQVSADGPFASTNEANIEKGWANVTIYDDTTPGQITLTFTSTRGFWSCFEVRTDGDTSQILEENGGVNYNTIADGLYPYVCERNSSESYIITANEYVEVRMVFGAESDERFGWTRFTVKPVVVEPTPTPTAEPTATPTPTEEPKRESPAPQNVLEPYHPPMPTAPACNDSTPGIVPMIYVDRGTPGDGKVEVRWWNPFNAPKVHIAYGTRKGIWEHALLNTDNDGHETINFLKNTMYYFEVGGVNGCNVGPFSRSFGTMP